MKYIFLFIITILVSRLLSADAIISSEKTTYDYGTVTEGEKEKITYKIPIKNNGSDPLKIIKIRKSCGCTSIAFDTLIMPGKSSIIQTEINIHGLSGKLKKCINILSNATNNKSLEICLESFIQKIIDLSEEYIQFGQKEYELFLSTKKSDLKVSKIYFEEIRRSRKSKEGQAKKIDIYFTQENLNNNHKAVIYTYKLKLSRTENISAPLEGYFTFETNHPQKPILKIMGTLLVE
jgi:hypothetical protein